MTGPTAAPAHFPYAHRTVEQVDRDERTRARVAGHFDESDQGFSDGMTAEEMADASQRFAAALVGARG